MITGASCPNGALFVPNVAGSKWEAADGVYQLVSCPMGYELVVSTQECAICPDSCYCAGGASPHTPCPDELFSTPGSTNASSCVAVVFVIVTLSLPVDRLQFTADAELRFQKALADCAGVSLGEVVVFSVAESPSAGWIEVVSKIANKNALTAQYVSTVLNSSKLNSSITGNGFHDFRLLSIEATACIEGYELNSEGQCTMCPANYYCPGGVTSKIACQQGTFSLSASNSSRACLPIEAVVVSISLPISKYEFQNLAVDGFLEAIALTANVPKTNVDVLSVDVSNSRRVESASILVIAQILCNDAGSAGAVSSRLSNGNLNYNLALQHLPSCTVQSIIVQGNSASSNATPFSVLLGSTLGCIFVFLVFAVACFYVTKMLQKYYANRAFLATLRTSKAGDEATVQHLPFALRKTYEAKKILGKGAFGCVIHAVSKKGEKHVAIKLIPSERGGFSPKESRQV